MLDLWKLKRRRDSLQRSYDNDLAALRARKASSDDISQHEAEEVHFMGEEQEAIDIFMSDKLLEEGTKYDVRIPASDDREFWVVSTPFSRSYLKPAGRNRVRRLIDEEKERRFNVKTLWVTKFFVPLLAALVGIIGAITGLVAVLRHTK